MTLAFMRKKMYAAPPTRIHKTSKKTAIVGMVLFFFFGAIRSSATYAQGKEIVPEAIANPVIKLSQGPLQQANKYFSTQTSIYSDGTKLVKYIINGPPVPPPGYEPVRSAVALPQPNPEMGTNTLIVPAFNWVFGCSSVSGAMIAGYYDRNGFPNIYTGPSNGGVMPLDNSSWPTWSDGYTTYPNLPLAASHNGVDGRVTRGSIDDYWIQYGSTAQDPYITGGWTQHTWGDAIGDYMKTSQFAYDNTDGSTVFWNYNSASQLTCNAMPGFGITDDGTYGRKLFYEARGYTVTTCYNQPTDNQYAGGFSFAQYKAEIDAGRPVMLNLAGHTIAGVGYNDSGNTVYIHDTWDYNTHTMTWGGSYSGLQLLSVSIVNLQTVLPVTAPTVTTNAAGGLTATGATLNGTVNANNASTTVTFQYGLTTAYGSTVTADQSPVSGNSNTAVSKTITGLTPNTTYHYRVIGVNSGGTTNGGDVTFTTSAIAPTATTNPASGVTSSGGILNGTVNPMGSATTYYFQWGTTSSYGNNTSGQSAGSGTSNLAVSANITGLSQHTVYHYRLVATNSAGTSYGSDGTFTTLSIYQVTPSIGSGAGYGNISPGTVQAVDQGSTTSFTVTPNTGYTASVGGSCGGALVGTTYTTDPVTADCTVIAGFTSTGSCQSQPVRIVRTNTSYTTLQEAYDAALDQDTLQTQDLTLTQNLMVNRNISVTLKGGYPCSYGSNVGNRTTLKGWIKTVSGGGALNIGGFNLKPDIQPPSVTTGSASNLSSSSATINGTVKPNSANTTYYFEWGTTMAYGTRNPLIPASAGHGTSDVAVSANLSGLTPNTLYHYRLVAENSAGTTNGSDCTFTTPCVFTVSPTRAYVTASSGGYSVNVTTNGGCGWSGQSDAGWISIDSGSSGTGNGTVQYSVTANPSKDTRTGTMTIAGQTVTVEQAGTPCGYALNATDQSFTAWGGSGSVTVTAVGGCTWSGVSNVNWVTITSGGSGTGNGTVNFDVLPNGGISPRSGTMTIAGTTFTVNQAAGPLTLSCSGPPVRNGATGITYATLQEAYNGALDGQTLQVQAISITGNLTVDRDISVTLEGGYVCDFSGLAGIMTNLRGRIKTTSGGGRLILRNFELDR